MILSNSGLLSRKRCGTLAQSFLTTLSFPAAYTLTPTSAAPNARSWSPSVSLTVYLGRSPSLTSGITAFLNAEKTGFAQAEFSVRCESCQSWVTREKLGVAKFARDAVLDPDDSNDLNVHGKAVYLP